MSVGGRIGLLGPYGYGNLGDAAIQDAAIQAISRFAPGAEPIGLSLNPSDTMARHGIPAAPIRRGGSRRDARGELGFLLRSWGVVRNLDLLLFSGGSQLDDFWDGPRGHPRTMRRWTALARAARVPVAFVGVGAGNLESGTTRRLVRTALAAAKYRSYRDSHTAEMVRKLGVNGHDPVVPDLAFGLDMTAAGSPWEARAVGILPMAWCDPRIWPVKDAARYAASIDALAGLAAHLLHEGSDVCLFASHVTHDRPAVADLATRIGEHMKGSASAPASGGNGSGGHRAGRLEVVPVDSVAQLLAAIGRTRAIVATRLHGVLLGLAARRPVLAVSYDWKVDRLMEDARMGLLSVPIATARAEELISRFTAMDGEWEGIVRHLEGLTPVYRCVLDEEWQRILALRKRA